MQGAAHGSREAPAAHAESAQAKDVLVCGGGGETTTDDDAGHDECPHSGGKTTADGVEGITQAQQVRQLKGERKKKICAWLDRDS